jgi:hypothetical protein
VEENEEDDPQAADEKKEEVPAPVSKTKIRLPDGKQSQNLEIMLRKLPKPQEIAKGILNLDSNLLSKDVLDLIFQNVCCTI